MKIPRAETIGAFDAKTHLSALLDKAAQGSVFLITKHGKPVARLGPVDPGVAAPSLENTLARAKAFRRKLKHRLDQAEIRDLIATGRR